MSELEKKALETRLLDLASKIDEWSTIERQERVNGMRIRLLQSGIPVDQSMDDAFREFSNGTMTFDDFSQIIGKKLPPET